MKYSVIKHFGPGWTDPRAMYGSNEMLPFSEQPTHAVLQEIAKVPEETLHNLWLSRFPQDPSYSILCSEPFYYALAYKWWNEKRLEQVDSWSVCGASSVYCLVPS